MKTNKISNFFVCLFGVCSPLDNDTTSGPNQKLIDYNDTHVLDFNPSLKTLCIGSVIKNNLDQTWLSQGIR